MSSSSSLYQKIAQGNIKALARGITIIENELKGSDELLDDLVPGNIPLIGITGPPGAGKSSLVNGLLHELLKQQRRIGVVAVDPSSPFNFGSLLGDRIRLAEHFNHPGVYIRSLATRGSLGGLSGKIMEVTDVMRVFPFDYIFIETVGVGQSEVEIAGLADTTIVVMVPEAGDEVQTMKAGLMEIADIFVVNKSDRPGADQFVKNLQALVAHHMGREWQVPVLKTVANQQEGIKGLLDQMEAHHFSNHNKERKKLLLAEKAWSIIGHERMKGVDKKSLVKSLEAAMATSDFSVYRFAKQFSATV